jgi:hypothetical protein
VPLRDTLREAGHAVAYAVLWAPLEVCLERAGTRDSQPLADPGVVERLWRDFSDLGELSRHAVDVGAGTPEEAADLVQARIGDGSLRA